jgi:hypothetical protein
VHARQSVFHRYFEGDRVAVVYRKDDNEPMIGEWSNDIGTGFAYAGISRSGYIKLANAKTIAIQLFFKSTHRAESIITVFEAVKTEEALRPIWAACPIENANEKSASRPFRPNEPYFPEPAAFVEEWKKDNELCQNGNSIEKPTADACKDRLSLETKLKSLGCSFSHTIAMPGYARCDPSKAKPKAIVRHCLWRSVPRASFILIRRRKIFRISVVGQENPVLSIAAEGRNRVGFLDRVVRTSRQPEAVTD